MNEPYQADDGDLAQAIGGVVMQAALVEMQVAELLVYASGGGKQSAFMWGQARERWDDAIALLEAHDSGLAARHRTVKLDIEARMVERNGIVHGAWVQLGEGVLLHHLPARATEWRVQDYTLGELGRLREDLRRLQLAVVELTNDTYWRPTSR